MSELEAIILGLIQGLTEFLPVSSSGHIVLGRHVLGIEATKDVTFEVFVHFGTAMSILTVYRKDIADLFRAAFKGLAKPGEIGDLYNADPAFKTVVFILITMIPTGIVYVVFKDQLEAAFADPTLVSGMLLVTGVLLLLTLLRKNTTGELTPLKSFFIGVAQSVAMIPGISRSGSTICIAIYQNVDQEKAANFSFLMVLPVIVGATILKFGEAFGPEAETAILPLILGTIVAYVSGIFAIRMVLAVVRKGNLSWFAYYCFFVGGLGLILI